MANHASPYGHGRVVQRLMGAVLKLRHAQNPSLSSMIGGCAVPRRYRSANIRASENRLSTFLSPRKC
jgi:hypothetical protein